MNGITHKQAQHFMHAELDGLLTDIQRRDLDTHLRECKTCRAESESLNALSARLTHDFHERWDTQDGPSQYVNAKIQSQRRRIIMSKQIGIAAKTLAGMAALVILGLAANFVFGRLRETTTAADGTRTVSPVSTPQTKRLIAFTSAINGNQDIYTVHADGSGLTNLTNNAAHDINPVWSPDGTRIAFQSDRTGLMQIYTMNADGSNLAQLTNNKVNHELMSVGGPWSPDGKRLLFNEWGDPVADSWKLYAIGADGQNKTLLAKVPPVYTFPSWSPDGEHIAFISDSRLYVVNSDGSNLTEITKSLPAGEVVDSYNTPNYYWALDGQSIFLIASNLDSVEGKTQGGEPNVNLFRWKAYEASLDGRTLNLNKTTHSPIGGWWKENYFVTPFVGLKPWTWVGSYGARTVDPFNNCTDTSGGGYIFSSSSLGNVAIGAMCPNGDWWLYRVTPQGVMSPLIASPIPTVQGSLDRLAWSPNDEFLAFNLTSNGKTKMYLIDEVNALKDPSVQPVQIEIGNGQEYSLPSWQPVPTNNIVEQKPTPEPTQSSSYNGLIAFVSEKSGTPEIYTMQADGSNVAGLTQGPAKNYLPAWSPDGRRIAFINETNGEKSVFMMNADGSAKIPLIKTSSSFSDFAWSPDGRKIAVSSTVGNKPGLYVIDVDGNRAATLLDGQGEIISGQAPPPSLGWSPDSKQIVYVKAVSPSSPDNITIYVVNVDGSGKQELFQHYGVFQLIGWQDAQHFYASIRNQDLWELFRFSTTGTPPEKIESGQNKFSPTILFRRKNDLIYVTGYVTSWTWYRIEGTKMVFLSTSSNYAAQCQKPPIQDITGGVESSLLPSPDGLYAMGDVICGDGRTAFSLASNDGSSVKPLFDATLPTALLEAHWSPDGQYILIDMGNSQSYNGDVYLVDLVKTLQDPSTRPIRLTTDGASTNAVWQPIPNNNTVEEKPTPEPTQIPSANTDPIAVSGFQFQISKITIDDAVKIIGPVSAAPNAAEDGHIISSHKGGLCFAPSGDVPCHATGDSVMILDVKLISGDMQKALEFEPKIIEAGVEKSAVEVVTDDVLHELYWIYDVNKSSHYSFLLKFPDGTTLDLQPLMRLITPPEIQNP
jgi:Tol biopolymer transport system component